MAGTIKLLSEEVIGKIAAGEVVERPSAAIKEMVENSLDAGATAITVEIRDGGISYFRVTDNGSGIRQNDIRMAFERHATSKISASQDLFGIRTLGFRGEALASIAAVAKVTCTTRTKQDVSGIKVQNNGGHIEAISETACPEGTSFVVKDLFYNTPVRLKFLKKPVTEAGYISDLMMRLILSRPDVSFRYISNGKTLYHSAGDGKLSSAVFSIYGNEMLRAMQEVNGHQGGVLLKGFVGVGDSSRATRTHESFYINGRYMKSAVLSSAVEAACRERLTPGKYPTCVLHLTMPYDMVDVNVHPNKLECRFQNDVLLAEAVESIIRDAFEQKGPLDKPEVLLLNPDKPVVAPLAVTRQHVALEATQRKEILVKNDEKYKIKSKTTEVEKMVPISADIALPPATQFATNLKPVAASVDVAPAVATPIQTKTIQFAQDIPEKKAVLARIELPPPVKPIGPVRQLQPIAPRTVQTSVQPTPTMPTFLQEQEKELRIIGSTFDSYILIEYQDTLLLVDQQGVHERLLFDRMLASLGTSHCAQELLIPMILPATRREQELLEGHRALLESIGLTIESFGETEVSVRSIPMILGQPQAGELVREVIEQLETERGIVSLEKRRAAILALACRRAVRKNERLTADDLRELVLRMVDQKITPTSPRGTPLLVALTHQDIDRRFRRF